MTTNMMMNDDDDMQRSELGVKSRSADEDKVAAEEAMSLETEKAMKPSLDAGDIAVMSTVNQISTA